ncbi:hypothetical protein CCMA1212_008948 [Trichoderma ghanense]|uniref:Uncharacterized protein n=1 Tax=Trichoderma ghanense TaxID=65468 RepID=A0ABY2GWB1_9HYPO
MVISTAVAGWGMAWVGFSSDQPPWVRYARLSGQRPRGNDIQWPVKELDQWPSCGDSVAPRAGRPRSSALCRRVEAISKLPAATQRPAPENPSLRSQAPTSWSLIPWRGIVALRDAANSRMDQAKGHSMGWILKRPRKESYRGANGSGPHPGWASRDRPGPHGVVYCLVAFSVRCFLIAGAAQVVDPRRPSGAQVAFLSASLATIGTEVDANEVDADNCQAQRLRPARARLSPSSPRPIESQHRRTATSAALATAAKARMNFCSSRCFFRQAPERGSLKMLICRKSQQQ